MRLIIVAGARPNFMKVAPVVRALDEYNLTRRGKTRPLDYILVHTGQHYDAAMSQIFFEDLGLPAPDIHLGVGSGTHAEQTGKVLIEFEKVCVHEKPDLVVVVGDVNSTLACALAATKLEIPVAHIEAGLRSFDRSMPEEINRILTDQISDYLFTTCSDADRNLLREGISKRKIHFVGNVMVDSLLSHVHLAAKSDILERLGLNGQEIPKRYAVVTLHRPSNVDDPKTLKGILSALGRIGRKIPVIFPAHPRSAKHIEEFGLKTTAAGDGLRIVAPLSYLDFLCLMSRAALVLTDSGGIQEETTILGIPCLTLRENTERPITIREGTNVLVGSDPERIVGAAYRALAKGIRRKKIPRYWDGKAAERIVEVLAELRGKFW
jgi:UDP-N-acetylglucosamine 2-epimerase (non-hydrolysing)